MLIDLAQVVVAEVVRLRFVVDTRTASCATTLYIRYSIVKDQSTACSLSDLSERRFPGSFIRNSISGFSFLVA